MTEHSHDSTPHAHDAAHSHDAPHSHDEGIGADELRDIAEVS